MQFFSKSYPKAIIKYIVNKSNYIRKCYQFKSFANWIWANYGARWLIVLSVYILGFVIGILVISPNIENLTCDNILDFQFVNFLNRDINCLSLFLSYTITYAIIVCYACLLNINIFLVICNFCIVFVFGFCFAYNMVIYTNVFGTTAIIVIVLIMPIFHLLIMGLYALVVAIFWHRYREIKKFGKICQTCQCYIPKKVTIISCILLILLLFVYCLLLNILLVLIVME